MRQLFILTAALICSFCFLALNSANAQVLTIQTGSILTINGGILDVNCLDILIKNGGTLDLVSGTIQNVDVITEEPGSTYNNNGTVITCGAKSFYIIPAPNGKATVITLPKR